ncbi:MAG: hypothetical protein JO359_11470 [Candidatus Eremiobacteraeota bacterium]|nr:hypothetical protein [Candidatus Eremiobacteraeota bacterium]
MVSAQLASRYACGVLGVLLASAGFALVPSFARSSSPSQRDNNVLALTGEVATILSAASPRLPEAIQDPFVRNPAPVRAIANPARAQSTSTPQSGRRTFFVRAIVTGAIPLALIDDGARTYVVGVGDRLGAVEVRAIGEEAVTFSDGRRVVVTELER